MDSPQRGYLVLADISGFDAYIASVELEHAQDILAELLQLLVSNLVPPLKFSNLHGDAVLAYSVPETEPSGQLMLEILEATYRAFRNHLITIQRETTCGCQACLTVPNLDLKFLVHYGEFTVSRISERTEINGLDAELVRRRLVKDQVSERETAYTLVTEAANKIMAVPLPDAVNNSGEYPVFGVINSSRFNMKTRFDALAGSLEVRVTDDEAHAKIEHTFSVPPQMLWEWLNSPDHRNQWMSGRYWTKRDRLDGRMGIGATNHCQHDSGSLMETVRDWRPFSYFTVDLQTNFTWMFFRLTYSLVPINDGGETVLKLLGRVHGPVPLLMTRPKLKQMMTSLENDMGRLEDLVLQPEAEL